ncbi:ATP-dependent DNA helicase II subunit 1 [Colletotrichum orbiculare MAFF 240422]|uniref:ATP-dependent DNA helicase II subunit 1 n=1 Tax=Colletotrichum orbiculare (strain 104-T / ATCC 96160 / CBS 514.97 / LARS 414 / MAFF 240422) TaxID=1213857 RepID=N4VM10_COLOR|nr:ATP-dependent DNA helicase II subunit 1 [Colletotrichum orbiculare MAFF 240422]
MADREGYRRDDDEEEGEEELDETDYKTQKDAVIFAIDVSNSMLQPPPASNSKKADKDSPMQAALKCAYQLMQQRIISHPKDMMGVLFFGTEKTKNDVEFEAETGKTSQGYPHCYIFTDLDVPAAEDVKALRTLVGADGEEAEDEDGVLVPSDEGVLMSNVFFCANSLFTTKAPNFGSRRLFIITDNDDPHGGDKEAKAGAAVRAKDLYDLGVVIELFPITRDDDKFDISKFYDDIIYRDQSSEANLAEVRSSKSGDGLSLLNSLVSNITSKETAKRSLFSNLPFEIAPGLKISVKGYNILHRQTPARTSYIWTEGSKLQFAVSETTKTTADENARPIKKVEFRKAFKFGGEYVHFKTEEQKSLKDFGQPVIRIIGFKPREMLPFWASVKKSTFIFPSEEDYVGSTRVFTALWQKLLDSKKIAVAWCITRANAKPILAAIIPSPEKTEDESATPFLPAGLWLHPLPFADDLRSGPDPPKELVRSSNELTDRMRIIVQQLQLPKAMFNPKKYPNPSLQWHYKILQAIALDDEVPEQPEDATQPKYKAISKRAGGYLDDWAETLEDEVKFTLAKQAIKRDADEELDEKPAKRARTTAKAAPASGSSMTAAQLRQLVEEGKLGKMVVAALKDILAAKGLSTAGKKAELVERIEEWVEQNA